MTDEVTFRIEVRVGRRQSEATIWRDNSEPYIWKEYGATMDEAVKNLMSGFRWWAVDQAIRRMRESQEDANT